MLFKFTSDTKCYVQSFPIDWVSDPMFCCPDSDGELICLSGHLCRVCPYLHSPSAGVFKAERCVCVGESVCACVRVSNTL